MSKDAGKFRFLHTMLRVLDLDKSIEFYTRHLGMELMSKREFPDGEFTLVFLGYGDEENNTVIELTHNWDKEEYSGGRNFGHLAYRVPDIYALCARLKGMGYTIHRPPRDGRMAFVKSPDGISVEFLQSGDALEPEEPWASMENTGSW